MVALTAILLARVLLEAGLVTSYDDIFTLKRGDLLALPRFAEKSVDNLLAAIENAKKVTLARLIIGLSIPQVGEETAHDLAQHFNSGAVHVQQWRQMDDEAIIEELVAIRGIGRWTAEMFLIFHLMRPNVMPLDDVGLRGGRWTYTGDRTTVFHLHGVLADQYAHCADVLLPELLRAKENVVGLVTQPDRVWFYKLMGEPKLVESQKDAFVKFVQSAKY